MYEVIKTVIQICFELDLYNKKFCKHKHANESYAY